jgi:hypothetical protein
VAGFKVFVYLNWETHQTVSKDSRVCVSKFEVDQWRMHTDDGLSSCPVKESHYRPGQALRVPGGCFQISRQSAYEVGEVVSPTHRPPLPPGSLVLIFVRG